MKEVDYSKLNISKLQECLDKLEQARNYLELSEKKFYDKTKQIGGYIVGEKSVADAEFTQSKALLTSTIEKLTNVIEVASVQKAERQCVSLK